jgi:hypothetical protein
MFKNPGESEAYTNHDQQRETETPNYIVTSAFLPTLLATSYLPLVTLLSRDFEHVNPTKRNGPYSAATTRMGRAATTTRFPQISFISFTHCLVFLDTCLYINLLFEHIFHTHNPLMSLILQESQHIKF